MLSWYIPTAPFTLRGFIPLIFQKHHFWLFDVFWYFKLWRIPPCYLFLLLRTFYVSIFNYKIDILEDYSLATTDIATSFTCFKPQYYTRKSSFYLFSMVENPVKPRITKSRKNLDKQDKIDLGKQTLSWVVLAKYYTPRLKRKTWLVGSFVNLGVFFILPSLLLLLSFLHSKEN